MFFVFFGLLTPSSLKKVRDGSKIQDSSAKHYILRGNQYSSVRFEVPTPVSMKMSIIWDITSCNPLKYNRCFGGTYILCSVCYLLHASFLLENEDDIVTCISD
jgi:hypothetical protein